MSYGARYASDKNALGICERCAEKMPLRLLRPDGQYPELRVCSDCWDPKHPQESLPPTFDPISLRDPTGDPEKAQASVIVIRDLRPVAPNPVDYWGDGDEPGTSNFDDVQIGGASPYAANVQLEAFSKLKVAVSVNKTKFNAITGGDAVVGDSAPELPAPNLDNTGSPGPYDVLFDAGGFGNNVVELAITTDGDVERRLNGFPAPVNDNTDWLAAADEGAGVGDDYEVRLDINGGDIPDGFSTGVWHTISEEIAWSYSATSGARVGSNVTLRVRRGDGTGEDSVTFDFFANSS